MNDFFDNYNGAQDVPDHRDYRWEDFKNAKAMAWSGDIKEISLELTPILNQGKKGACTAFGTGNAFNETVAQECDELGIEWLSKMIDPDVIWAKALEHGASNSGGWIFQSMLKLYRTEYGVGTVLLAGPWELTMDLLSEVFEARYAIVTGSMWFDYRAIRNDPNHIAVRLKSGTSGHVFAGARIRKILDKLRLGHPNSWGPEWGDHGWFYTDEETFKLLFSTYVVIPKRESYILEAVKTGKMEKYWAKSICTKVCNGENPEAQVTPLEIAKMFRLTGGTGGNFNPSRGVVINAIQDHIVKIPNGVKFHDGTRFKDKATDEELYAMLLRAWYNDPLGEKRGMTRKTAASLLIRDFVGL